MCGGGPPARDAQVVREGLSLLDLPTEILNLILRQVDPDTLLSVRMVDRRMRDVAAGVKMHVDLSDRWRDEDTRVLDAENKKPWDGTKALRAVSLYFPRFTGLWTFSRFPLHDACEAGLTHAVTQLLNEDKKTTAPRINDVNEEGNTALCVACGYQTPDIPDLGAARYKIVERLIEKGADVNEAGLDERMNAVSSAPLWNACRYGYIMIAQLLVENDAGIDAAYARTGATPLFVACTWGHLEVVRLLVEKGANLNKARDTGATPLSIACEKGHLEVVQVLVGATADMNKADNDGETPLFIACWRGHLEIVRLLAEKGADLDKATNHGDTPLSAARERGHFEIVALLKGAGARV